MSIDKTSPAQKHAKGARVPMPVENTTDATRGEPLAMRARKRKAELENAMASLPDDETRARSDLGLALASVELLLTGNEDHLSDATAADLNRWLENTKHLAEVTPKTRRGGR